MKFTRSSASHEGSPYNWLEVRFEETTVYVAKEHTLRQPAETLEPGQYHEIPDIDCNLRFLKDDHSRKTIAFAITGDNATAIEVALFRPNSPTPCPTMTESLSLGRMTPKAVSSTRFTRNGFLTAFIELRSRTEKKPMPWIGCARRLCSSDTTDLRLRLSLRYFGQVKGEHKNARICRDGS